MKNRAGTDGIFCMQPVLKKNLKTLSLQTEQGMNETSRLLFGRFYK